MELIVDIILELFSIVLMGFIFFTVYVYGKIFLIKIGLIDQAQDDESINDKTDWKSILGWYNFNDTVYKKLV